jgi:hypothetical protein
MADRPAEMLTGTRVADPDFSKDELLYRRFLPKHLMPGKKVNPAAIDLPDMSVNRSKHGGRLEYVLVGHEGLGVISFSVGDVPPQLWHEGCSYSFKPVHAPQKKNYFHAEIQCFDFAGDHIAVHEKVPPRLLLRWRLQLHSRVRVEREPAVCSDSSDYYAYVRPPH